MDALEAIAVRHSTRSFKRDPIPWTTLEKIVNAGRLAATGRNEQPWDFVVLTDAAMRRKLADLTDYGKFIADAPACVVVLCRKTQFFLEDGSAASQNILVAAAALGVHSCWVSGHTRPYADAVRKLVGAPEAHVLVSLLALGYEATADERRPKRTLDQVLHREKF